YAHADERLGDRLGAGQGEIRAFRAAGSRRFLCRAGMADHTDPAAPLAFILGGHIVEDGAVMVGQVCGITGEVDERRRLPEVGGKSRNFLWRRRRRWLLGRSRRLLAGPVAGRLGLRLGGGRRRRGRSSRRHVGRLLAELLGIFRMGAVGEPSFYPPVALALWGGRWRVVPGP